MELVIVEFIGLFLVASDFGNKYLTPKDRLFISIFTVYLGIYLLMPAIIKIYVYRKKEK
ncbi:hypothetical protein M2139_001511 [Enterococcus sp. PF1-24]|uniref:hypothetical protein n=1 Tax=unclassified Enterococcus TaxID=2608891 RepID=UPI0024750B42|nr:MULTISPECIES: hypothetical protein [unclassified Enterococcus]MDH6364498.1 hypothetical protein [Enterococcus sp. PFB1-1]MDH6401625.1 hypothetical protein [Enterococcus sp. PF1-24]